MRSTYTRVIINYLLPLALLFPLVLLAAPLEKVKVSQFGKERFLLYLPFYVAMEEGIFEKQGLDIELIFAGNDDQIFASVIGGVSQFGLGDPIMAAISKDKGGPGKVIAMMITKLGLSGYTNNKEITKIDDPKKLKGLRISSFPSPSTTFTLLTELKRNYPEDLKDMKIVQAAFGAQLATLEAGLVDIAVDIEPTVSIAEAQGYPVVFSLDLFTPHQAITGITVLEDTIKNHPELCQKIVNGLAEGLKLLKSDPAIGKRVGKKIYPNLDDKVIDAAITRMTTLDMYPASPVVVDELWQRSLKTRIDAGDIKKAQPTDLVVDNTFAKKAAVIND